MQRRLNRIQQAYGYTVCLIAIITGLIAGKQMLNAGFDLSRPSLAGQYGPASGMESFEAFKMERQARSAPPNAQAAPLPPDSTLRRIYTEERDAAARLAHWQAMKSLVTDALLLVVSIALFAMHWRWLRNATDESDPVSTVTRS